MSAKEWIKELQQEREDKDRFFASHPQSPLPLDLRPGFRGLNYFPIDPDYRFELELSEYSEKETVDIEDTKGNMRNFLEWGEFQFDLHNTSCTLQVYKSDAGDDSLFIPFRDTTNGEKTYGAGRYLDLYPEHKTKNGMWILDFNRAYNPWCAYNPDYACPFVLADNWLKTEIRAGEKEFRPVVVT